MRAALNDAADLVRLMIEEKGLRLFVHTEQLISRFIFSDKDRLTQVVVNLMSNACKYTLEGRISLKACMGSNRGRQTLEVSVQDTGVGIKEDDQQHLFKLFSRLNEGEQLDKSGIGLGLSICKSIVN